VKRGYHGVNFGGIIGRRHRRNRKTFGPLLPGADHIRHNPTICRRTRSRAACPSTARLADDLERLVALHDASTIAAVIVEPVAAPPACCCREGLPAASALDLRKHGILLIATRSSPASGGSARRFAAEHFGVTPYR